MKRKQLIALAGMGLLLAAMIAIICRSKAGKLREKTDIVCSFYPMYIMTENLVEGTGFSVANMTSGLTGCVHDYQITTKDMKAVEKAEVVVANGLEAESFLEDIRNAYPTLPILEAYTDEGENSHVWMDPRMHVVQIENIGEALAAIFKDEASVIRKNTETYSGRVAELAKTYEELEQSGKCNNWHAICYNEAFEIFAENLGFDLIAVFSLDEEELPSAGEIAEAIETGKKYSNVVVFIEEDKAYHADKLVNETGARVVFLSPITYGSDEKDAYIKDMNSNLNKVSELVK